MPNRMPTFGPPLETVRSQEVLDPGQLPGGGGGIPGAALAQLRAEFASLPRSPRERGAAEAVVTVSVSAGRPAEPGAPGGKEGREVPRQSGGDGPHTAASEAAAVSAREEELRKAHSQTKAKLRRARKVLSKLQAAAEAAFKAASDTERLRISEREQAISAVRKLQGLHEKELLHEREEHGKQVSEMTERHANEIKQLNARLKSAKEEQKQRACEFRPLAVTIELLEARAAAARAEATAELLAARLAGMEERVAAARGARGSGGPAPEA